MYERNEPVRSWPASSYAAPQRLGTEKPCPTFSSQTILADGKALGEISKEFVYIAVGGDRLGNLQQGLVPLRECFTGRCGLPIHRPSVWPISL